MYNKRASFRFRAIKLKCFHFVDFTQFKELKSILFICLFYYNDIFYCGVLL